MLKPASIAIYACVVEFSALVFLMLRISAYRKDRAGKERLFGWPAYGPFSLLSSTYTEEGRRLLPWAWALCLALILTALYCFKLLNHIQDY